MVFLWDDAHSRVFAEFFSISFQTSSYFKDFKGESYLLSHCDFPALAQTRLVSRLLDPRIFYALTQRRLQPCPIDPRDFQSRSSICMMVQRYDITIPDRVNMCRVKHPLIIIYINIHIHFIYLTRRQQAFCWNSEKKPVGPQAIIFYKKKNFPENPVDNFFNAFQFFIILQRCLCVYHTQQCR